MKKIFSIMLTTVMFLVFLNWLVFADDETGRIVGKTSPGNVGLTLFDSANHAIAHTGSDENGDFVFENVPPGDYTIYGGKDNYVNNADHVTVRAGETTNAHVFLPGGHVLPPAYLYYVDFKLGNVTGKAGDTIEIPMNIFPNERSHLEKGKVQFSVQYDRDKLTFAGLQDTAFTYIIDNNWITVYSTEVTDFTGGYELMLNFKINDDAQAGYEEMQVSGLIAIDEERTHKRVKPVNGSITIVDYFISDISLKNAEHEAISEIPETGDFIAEVELEASANQPANSYLFVAAYNRDGRLLNIQHVQLESVWNEKSVFEFLIPQQDEIIDEIKAYVWESYDVPIPLALSKDC